MSFAWYYWLVFAASWSYAITFWVKSTGISKKWLKLVFVCCGLLAFALPFFWGWLLS